MDILNLMKEQDSCLRFIEEKRWKDSPVAARTATLLLVGARL